MNFRIVKLFYDIAYAEARLRAGLSLSAVEEQHLNSLRELVGGDPGWHRRTHRRLPVQLDATMRHAGRDLPVTITDMSGGGAAVFAPRALAPGARVVLKISGTGTALHAFPCTVRRIEADSEGCRLALAFDGIPLELRRAERATETARELYRAAS